MNSNSLLSSVSGSRVPLASLLATKLNIFVTGSKIYYLLHTRNASSCVRLFGQRGQLFFC